MTTALASATVPRPAGVTTTVPTRAIDLAESLDGFVEERVRSGACSDASAVVREGLALLRGRQEDCQARVEALRDAPVSARAEVDRGDLIELAPDEIAGFLARRGLEDRQAAVVAEERGGCLRLTRSARNDLAGILVNSAEGFGEAGRRRCAALLEVALQDLREDPERQGSRPLAPSLGDALRSYHPRFSRERARSPDGLVGTPRHLPVYEMTPDAIIVLRVLHEAVDLPHHIPSGAASWGVADRRMAPAPVLPLPSGPWAPYLIRSQQANEARTP